MSEKKKRKRKAPLPLQIRLHDEERILRAAIVLMDGRSSQAKAWGRIADLLSQCQTVIRAVEEGNR